MNDAEKKKLELEPEIVFRYYEDQWTHVRHHEKQMSTTMWQVLLASVALVTAYSQTSDFVLLGVPLRLTISFVIILLGALGTIVVQNTAKAARTHIDRARAARQSLGFLEDFASVGKSAFPNIYLMYAAINIVAIVTGLLLAALCLLTQTAI